MLCKKLDLFTDAFVAIDGSKFKAVNSRDRNFSRAKMKRRMQQIDESVERYLRQMESVDRQESEIDSDKTRRLKDKIIKLEQEMNQLKNLEVQMLEAPDQQISLTDPDARAMGTTARGSGMVGYNVQTAVDVKNHLILVHEVTNVGHDRHQLANMSKQAKEVIGTDNLSVVADRGYFKGEEILACEEADITPYLPKPQTSNNMAKGLFGKRDFIYSTEDDEYKCPANEILTYRSSREEKGQLTRRYWTTACQNCSIKSQCTTAKERRVSRWEHEAVVDAVEARLNREPERMKARKETVEHPFGTIKSWMGYTHFQTRTLARVSTEMSLHVLAYNMKRLIAIVGVNPLIEAIGA